MKRDPAGKDTAMDEPDPNVEVTVTAQDDSSADICITGELTEDARRPLVRVMTDLMLHVPGLRQVQLDTTGVTFLNSAGVSALVQLEKMGHPRGIEVPLVVGSSVVSRPLQVSGLWRRFRIIDRREGVPPHTHEPLPPGAEHS
jgi:stage II sporulation protein AA (anti-sigma F factor antagonist)